MKKFLLLMPLLLCGCDAPKNITPEEVKLEADRQANLNIVEYELPGSADVLEFKLQDGTRCVTKHGSQNGITCDWRK